MSAGLVAPDLCHPMVDRLAECVVPYPQALEAVAAHPWQLDLQGLLSHGQRQNAEDIATLVDVERQVIHDCSGLVPWDHRPLVTVLVGHAGERWGDPEGSIAFDPRSFPTRGTPAVGVQRQWCGHRGPVDTCQVGVFMGDVSRHDHAWLDCRVYWPGKWTRDALRRQECHVPPDMRDQTRQEPCVERLDAWGEQVPHGWVTGDDARGRHTRFRQERRTRGERYGLGVPCHTTMRDLEAPLPEDSGRGRRPRAPWPSVTDGRTSLSPTAWTRVTVRDGANGPVAIAMVRRRVQTRIERPRMRPQAWRVVTRRPLSDARTWEPRASREATDQDTRQRDHDDRTPASGAGTALRQPSLAELARVIKAGAGIEARFHRGTRDVGMEEDPVRTWQGWHHHLA